MAGRTNQHILVQAYRIRLATSTTVAERVMARPSSRLLASSRCWLQQTRGQHTSSSSSSGHSATWLWPVTAAAAAAGLGSLFLQVEAQHQQQQQPRVPPAPAAVSAWLAEHGAEVSAVEVGPSPDPAAGSALFATPPAARRLPAGWLGRRLGSWLLPRSYQAAPLATFPLNLALTAEAAVSDPQLGPSYSQLLEEGLVGEREVVILMLLVERLRGSSSKWAPWIQQLPHRPSTPLTYSEQQLEQLKGTQLAAAAAALRRSATNQWQQVAPAAQAMLKKVGVQQQASYEDWAWAVATFWSRAQSLPVPPSQPPAATTAAAAAAAAAAGGAARGGGQGGSLRVLEGIVPGLDFANHSMTPNCWWDVVPGAITRSSSSALGPAVRLMADRVCWPRPGQELTISYGDKGNEELLLLYGFALPANPHDTLMVPCPLPPPDQWKEDTPLRLQLLMAQGLRPQLFLTRSHLNTLDAQQQKRTSTRRSPSPGSSSTCIPEQAQQVLSVFVLSARELQPRLQQLQREVHATGGVAVAPPSSPGGKQTTSSSSSSGSRRGDSSKLQQASALVEELGVHMAMITTFVRLLELQLLRLEGPEGTGPLEQDEQLLQQLLDQVASSSGGSTDTGKTGRTPTAAAAAGVGAQRAAGAASAAGDAWLRSCVAYRVGQKQLVRGYLRHATAELNDTMAALTAAVAEEEGLRERA